MRKLFFRITIFLLFCGKTLHAQEFRFNRVLKNELVQPGQIIQDNQGVLWISDFSKGLMRYDGVNLRTYSNDPDNPTSISPGTIIRMMIDRENNIWIGMLGKGLDRLDPATNTFTHFRHNPKDASSLSNDSVMQVLEDHSGNLWVGTFNGLNLLNRKTGKFTHYRNDPNDPLSISHNNIYDMYKDKKEVLWVVAAKFSFGTGPTGSTVNRFDKSTGKFTRYLQDPTNPNSSIPGKGIHVMYEDRINNFWIGTDVGLYNMNRSTGKCTRYYPDPLKPGVLGEAPVAEKIATRINMITEDSSGALWVSMPNAGINRYDPVSKKSTHFGPVYDGGKLLGKDTATGFTFHFAQSFFNSKDGLFWVVGDGLYCLNYNKTTIPFYDIGKNDANAFYFNKKENILWIGTDNGLLRKDLARQSERSLLHDPQNNRSISYNEISTMKADEKGNIWVGTRGGLNKFDPVTENFVHYKHDAKDPGSIFSDFLYYVFIDHSKNVWAATDSGLSRMDMVTEQFTNYKLENRDTTLFFGDLFCIAEDPEHYIWVSSGNGAIKLNTKTGKFSKYLLGSILKTICVDSKGIVWAGGIDGIYFFDKTKDEFILFANRQSAIGISDVINIIEDDQKSLWVSTNVSIIKISEDRVGVKKFTDVNGVRTTGFRYNDNYKTSDGRLFLGIGGGYYSFYPNQVKDNSMPPQLSITGFKLGNREIKKESGGILSASIWETTEIKLKHNENVFSFDFLAIDYITPGDEKYLFMLENYDDTWHDIGADHRASFFNIPPGNYVFRVKAVNSDGGSVEKSIRIIIRPPWYKTWWAYTLFALLAAGVLRTFIVYRSRQLKRENRELEEKVGIRTTELQQSIDQLKATQSQLIQSEKMASLGELTAGIAHEIQNPLNFVNNFSEVNTELIDEVGQEMDKGNISGARSILNDIKENEQKINHHGKRADAIVKGMVQHSRSSSGQKEPTDINALADEYLRLAYHGLRAKDKSFNATMKTDFDKSIGNINIIPQDIGRVILNLITNAFYALSAKASATADGYEPTVSVSTKKVGEKVLVSVKDNGNGIPPKVLDKIFQPFFTTKPTGQGTGLGLSLSYDIVKAHGGELKVETKEGVGCEFIILLPNQTS